MPESPRERVLQSIKAVLAGMSGTRFFGGAYKNPPTVSLGFLSDEQINSFPFAALIEAPGSRIDPALGTVDADKDEFRFDLYGVTDGDATVSPRQWAGRFREDCKKTLRNAISVLLDPACMWIQYGQEDMGYDDNLADFVVPCTAWLRYDLGKF